MKSPARRRHFVAAFLFIAHALGIASSLDALMSVRTAPGAVAWIVSLNTVPYPNLADSRGTSWSTV